MNFSGIKYCDIANGPGCRTVLFVSGCRNHCPGCFQPETWKFDNGNEFTADTENEIIESLKPNYIRGLTLLGGDPFEPENQRALMPLIRKMKKELPSKDIWAYTGYVLERDIKAGGTKHTDVTDELLSYIDVLVDGPFVEELKDISLKFRGSSNQRIIDMRLYTRNGSIVEL